jgi:hypothetical protein
MEGQYKIDSVDFFYSNPVYDLRGFVITYIEEIYFSQYIQVLHPVVMKV